MGAATAHRCSGIAHKVCGRTIAIRIEARLRRRLDDEQGDRKEEHSTGPTRDWPVKHSEKRRKVSKGGDVRESH